MRESGKSMERQVREGICYIRKADGFQVESCELVGDEVCIPDEIDGIPVTGAEAYAFSAKQMKVVRLSRNMRKLGKYVFYRCFELRSLSFGDCLTDIGAGAFTGCRPETIRIDCRRGEKTCLKFIADEVRYRLDVTICCHREDGSMDTARLVFPEHYEEAVENTPARIVETHYHGSGGYYRQCFYDRELNYAEYDSLLPWAVAEEEEETVVDIAVSRLRYPYRLSQKAKQRYEAYLREHMDCAGPRYALREDMDMLRFFGQSGYWTRESIGQAAEAASRAKKTEVLSALMDAQRRYFPKKKKGFEW